MEFAPEYFEGEIKDGFYVPPLMKRAWAAQLEVLEEIDRICTRHHIKYVAVYGTLLGAIRHKGFIPWDDDLDIAMLREDYQRFIYYARKELPEEWLLADCADEGFDTLLARVTSGSAIRVDQAYLEKFHGCPFVVGVDVFPIEHVPDNDEEAKILVYMAGLLDLFAVNWEKCETDLEDSKYILKNLEEITGQSFDKTKPLKKQIFQLADKVLAMYWNDKTEYVALMSDFAKDENNKWPASCLDKIIRIPFENMMVPVIEDYGFMLRTMFGEEYMEPRLVYDTHEYPFYAKRMGQLRSFYQENGMALPECFHSFCREEGIPLISVIIPCRNVERGIDRCLASLMCQSISVTCLEIICIDCSSEDGTLARLKEWERKLDNLITIVQCESDESWGSASNIGIEYAEAEYVTFLDANDYVEVDCFEKLYRPLQFADFDVVSCNYETQMSVGSTCFMKRKQENNGRSFFIDSVDKRKSFIKLALFGHEIFGKIIKKDILFKNQICFSDQCICETSCVVSLLYFYADKIYIQDDVLYHHCVDNSIMPVYLDLQHLKWQTWEERGLLEVYRPELEYGFLRACYLDLLKGISNQDDQSSYKLFVQAKELVYLYVPDYKKNRYWEKGFTEFEKVLLEMIDLPVGQEAFLQMVDMVKRYGM